MTSKSSKGRGFARATDGMARGWAAAWLVCLVAALAVGCGSDEIHGGGPRDTDLGDAASPPGICSEPLDRTTATSFYEASRCLWDGPDAPQRNVAPTTIDPVRVAIVRGRVTEDGGRGLADARVTLLGHAELGETRTRDDGAFDMAVNGGSTLTVRIEAAGKLPVQRQVRPEWRSFAVAPEVTMLAESTVVSTIEPKTGGLATSETTSDASGDRRVTAIFASNTRATMRMPDGRTEALPAPWHVRLTEYTRGDRGPSAMPGDLPTAVGYTYATEFSVDEARDKGAIEVDFDPPVVVYVDNFLHFKAGTTVPSGSFDRESDVWRADDSGVVLDVLRSGVGTFDVDVDGDGKADSDATLEALGVTKEERRAISADRPGSSSLWRVALRHFSVWDFNWGWGPPDDSIFPSGSGRDHGSDDCKTRARGSIIGCTDRTLGEVASLAGVPYALHYQSERAPGNSDARLVDIEVTGSEVPKSLARVEVEIEVLGQVTKKTFPPIPNQSFTYAWNGRDAYGREWQGRQTAHISVGYVYPGSYQATARFGETSGERIEGDRTRQEVTLWSRWRAWVGALDSSSMSVGGWSLDVHHAYDPMSRVLYLGNGRQRTAEKIGSVITTVAGTGVAGGKGDGGKATDAEIEEPHGIVVAPDGTVFLSEDSPARIRKITPAGMISTYAGTGESGFSGDGGPAVQAKLSKPMGLALGRDGTLFVADAGNRRVRAIAPNGIIRTFAGGESNEPHSGDGGPATEASFEQPHALAMTPDGSLYVADSDAGTVRRIGPDGRISTVAGGGTQRGVDDIPATQAILEDPLGLTVGPSQEIYVTEWDGDRVRRIDPSGTITTVIGIGTGSSDDGALAKTASISQPHTVDLGPDGSLYVTEEGRSRVRRVTPDGRVETIAGGGDELGDGGAPRAARFSLPRVVFVHKDGSLWIADFLDNRIRHVRPSLPAFTNAEVAVAAEDGSALYVFDAKGRHLRTTDALTNVTLVRFDYDAAGRLAQVRDRDGDTTRIERAVDGQPTAIVGPHGTRTSLTTTNEGWLSSITDPTGVSTTLEYDDRGLLVAMRDGALPSAVHSYAYDTSGKLVKDTEPSGAFSSLAQTHEGDTRVVTLTTRLGRTSRHETSVETDFERSRFVDSAGFVFTAKRSDGQTDIETPRHTARVMYAGDPRFGMQAPYAASLQVRSKGGLSLRIERSRSTTLADPSDLTTVKAWSETTTIGDRVATTRWDASARTMTFESPEGRRRTMTLDERGHVVRIQLPDLPAQTYTYDEHGRVTTTTWADRTAKLGYDATGFLASVRDPLGRTIAWSRDAAGRPQKVLVEDGASIATAWDGSGRLVGLTPPGKELHAFEYAPFQLLSAYIPPAVPNAGAVRTGYAYDGDDRIARTTHPDGSVVEWVRDSAGRLSRLQSPNEAIEFSYDKTTGTFATATRGDVRVRREYDGDLPTAERWAGPVAGAVTREWGDDFVPLAENVQGTRISNAYDRDGYLVRAGDLYLSRSPTTAFVTASSIDASSDAWTFDPFGDVASYEASGALGEVYTVTFTRDALGRIVGRHEVVAGSPHDDAFKYDVRGRLIEVKRDGVVVGTYAYDANDNRTRSNGLDASYDAQDRIRTFGAESFTHGPNGEVRQKAKASFGFSALGELRSAVTPMGTSVEYILDPTGRRIGRKVGGALVQGFLYRNALDVAAELDGQGKTISVFIYGARHVPEAMLRDGRVYRLVSDERGSPRLVVDASTGVTVQAMDYDVWGAVIRDTNPGFQPFGFAGGLYDRDTGLVHFGARDYDPGTGRWISKDPSGFAGGLNLYAYANNDPVNSIDRDGRNPILVGAVIGGAIGFFGSAAYQYYTHGCVDWGDAALWGLAGAAAGAVGGWAYEGLAAAGEAAGGSLESEFVNLASPQRTAHITVGDATGGGHMWPGAPGKTAFPQGWSAEKIMHNVSDIATDPALTWVQQTGNAGSLFTKAGAPARFFVTGAREGVGIKVILEPAGEGIITAFPIGGGL